jgi:hypothetical protein
MDDVGLVEDGTSEIPAQLLRGSKVDLSPAEQCGQLALETGKSEIADCSPWLEFDKHIDVAVGPEILPENRPKKGKAMDPVPCTEFGDSVFAYFDRWGHGRCNLLSQDRGEKGRIKCVPMCRLVGEFKGKRATECCL